MITENKPKNKTAIKIIITIGVILILVFLFFLKTPFYRQIDTTVTALMINGANTETSEVKIKIKGEYNYWLFGGGRGFEGNFIIDGFDVTKGIYTVQIAMDYKFYHPVYWTYTGSQLESYCVGIFYIDNDFKSFVIIPYQEYVDDPAYKGNTTSIDLLADKITAICYPANTRDEAVKMVNELFEDPAVDFHMK